MTLSGEYEPSPEKWVRDQVETYESSGGTEGTTMRGVPVVVVTSLGAKSGKLRKNPLMRVEHEGSYALVASKGGAPEHPTWYHNLVAHPTVEVQDGPDRREYTVRVARGRRACRRGGSGRSRSGRTTRTTRRRPTGRSRCSSPSRPEPSEAAPPRSAEPEGQQRAQVDGPPGVLLERRARRRASGRRAARAGSPTRRGSAPPAAGRRTGRARRSGSSQRAAWTLQPPPRCTATSSANTCMVLATKRAVPSGCAQAPRPTTSRRIRCTSSTSRGSRSRRASRVSASAIRGSPLTHGPALPGHLVREVRRDAGALDEAAAVPARGRPPRRRRPRRRGSPASVRDIRVPTRRAPGHPGPVVAADQHRLRVVGRPAGRRAAGCPATYRRGPRTRRATARRR